MKILHFASFLGDSGVAKVAVELCNEMARQGHEVTLVSQTPPSDIKFFASQKVNFVNLKGAEGLRLDNSLLRKLLKNLIGRVVPWFLSRHRFKSKFQSYVPNIENFDLIFVHCLPGKVFLSSLNHKNIFYVVHNTKSRHLNSGYATSKFLNKVFFYQALKNKKVIAVSKSVKEDLVDRLGFNREVCRVVYNPFDFDEIISKKEEAKPLDDAKRLVSIGRLSEQKRFDRLIRAMHLLNEKGVVIDLYLLGEGPLEKDLISLAEELNIASLIHFEGFVKNPYSYLGDNSIFVLPSDYEGLPTVLIEAAVCGCRVVTTPVSGAYEILGDDYPYVTEGFDIEELSDLILLAIEERESAVYSGLERFSSQRVVKKYLSLYDDRVELN